MSVLLLAGVVAAIPLLSADAEPSSEEPMSTANAPQIMMEPALAAAMPLPMRATTIEAADPAAQQQPPPAELQRRALLLLLMHDVGSLRIFGHFGH